MRETDSSLDDTSEMEGVVSCGLSVSQIFQWKRRGGCKGGRGGFNTVFRLSKSLPLHHLPSSPIQELSFLNFSFLSGGFCKNKSVGLNGSARKCMDVVEN